MQTLSLSTFDGAGALFTGVTTGQVDTGDWPLTASQQASACPSTAIIECSQPVADHGYFEIQFDLSNPLWGVRQDFGTGLGGIELRQGVAHLVDKQNFAATNAACNGIACTPNDAAMPICVVGNCNNGGLYSANPCSWDTKYGQTGTACVVGAAGGTAYNCSLATAPACPGTVSGIGGTTFSFQRTIGSKDFCAAANHFQQAFIDAGITGVTLNANCELNPPVGGWPARVTAFGAGTTGPQTCSGQPVTANVCFIVRTTQPRRDLGDGVAQQICALFSPAFVSGGWTTLAGQPFDCAPYLQVIHIPITSVCAFTTSNTGTPNNCWGMLTAGFILVFPYDSSTYFGYNSQFATKTNVTCLTTRCDPGVAGDTTAGSTCTGPVLTDAPGNYVYSCDPSYDSLSSLMEFANCLGSPGPSPDPTPGASSPTFATCAGAAVSGTCGASSGCTSLSAGYQALNYFGSHVFTMPIWSGIDRFPVHNCWNLGNSADPGIQAEFGGSASGLGSTTYVFDYLNAYCSQTGSGGGFGPAGVYRAGLMDTASTVSPFKATTFWDFDVLAAVYDSLFNPNPMCNTNPPSGSGVAACTTNLQTIDWMTTSHTFPCNAAVGNPCTTANLGYTPPPNTGATLQLTLNPNMKWHDSGLSVTAWDIKWTFVNLNATGSFQASSLSNVAGIQVLSPTKLDLNLKARGPFTDLFIGGITIMPGHTWSACGASTWNSQVSGTNLAGTTLVKASEDNCVGSFTGFSPYDGTASCPTSSVSNSAGTPVGCIGKTATNVSYADATFDPITNGFLIGSGAWVCENTGANGAVPVGTVGTGCSADNTQSPAIQLGAYTLTRMGCNIATGACVAPTGSSSPPPTGNGSDYFHSSGFLALYIWSGMWGASSDVLKLAAVNSGSSAVINHYKQGIGNPGGTGNNAVSPIVKARVNAFKGYSWLAFSTEKTTGSLINTSCAPNYREPGTTAANTLCPGTGAWSPSAMPGIGGGYSSTGAPILYQWGAPNTFGTVATPDPARTNGVFTQTHSNVYALVGAQWFTGGAAGSGCATGVGTAASAYPLAGYDC